MMSEVVETSTENDVAGGLNYRETELTLGLPGESRPKMGAKRGFSETVEYLSLGVSKFGDESEAKSDKKDEVEDEIISEAAAKSPKAKNQVVGWPPVRSFRQNMIKPKKFVKVAVDGAPYLRKVDLETYSSYQQLLRDLGEMFTCFTICDSRLIDPTNGSEYVPTYEDKDGDWMLVGDVPWKMFVESCKRVRLMKRSEVTGLAPKSSLSSSSRS